MPEDKVLKKAANAYELNWKLLTYVGGNVNHVYQYPAENGQPSRILRLSNQNWRNEKEALAELHFIEYLFDNGVSVPKIFPSKAGKLVEKVTDHYHVSVFSKAPGRIPTEEDWNEKMFINWGRIVGQMHLLTKSYIPLNETKRRDWIEEPWMDMMRHLPSEEPIARQKAREMLNWLETLPKDKKNYGLVHCDLHAHNIFATLDGTITAFDFDDCCYHWFAYDIAIILYSVILRYNRQDNKSNTLDDNVAWFLDSFLKGYQEVHSFEDWWLKAMPKLLNYRRLLDYNFLHQRYNWDTVDSERKIRWLRLKEGLKRINR
ncbi:phosphotransferase enzyme family protein [Lederbergia wuyishanensis]|uniref:Ser/Thr protein kinase RdoA (MazF antagonist) n=1 Tax=Lederbergia wuyishanensis TaxID=1347903 RepID=A0ABU0D9Z0_9BACI|nr:phosphotransferase [Lederbergia wuyishanensis]MCJ8008457.1 phosphotransferase [Lederbergia wuyishanensis]MDQ0345200.1 Ser/Thr protein kinase RdoA (MazF antagonist) [Lederbergia wuyishanensis]